MTTQDFLVKQCFILHPPRICSSSKFLIASQVSGGPPWCLAMTKLWTRDCLATCWRIMPHSILCRTQYMSHTKLRPIPTTTSQPKPRWSLFGTQEWEFFWLWFWILYYFLVSSAEILRFCKKNFDRATIWGDTTIPLSLKLSRTEFNLVWD